MSQERPSPGQMALLAGVALALVGGMVLYRHSKGGQPFGLRAEQPGDPEPARVLAPPTGSTTAREPFLAGDAVNESIRSTSGTRRSSAPWMARNLSSGRCVGVSR